MLNVSLYCYLRLLSIDFFFTCFKIDQVTRFNIGQVNILVWLKQKIFIPMPGIEPGPPGWKPGILNTRPHRTVTLGGIRKIIYSPNLFIVLFCSFCSELFQYYNLCRLLGPEIRLHLLWCLIFNHCKFRSKTYEHLRTTKTFSLIVNLYRPLLLDKQYFNSEWKRLFVFDVMSKY